MNFVRPSFALVALLLPTGCSPTTTSPALTKLAAGSSGASSSMEGEMARLDFYVGDWDCKGTTLANTQSPAQEWSARIGVRKEAGGKWLSVRMDGPGDNHSFEFKGYDQNEKRWVHAWASSGGSSGTYVASGWEGDRMVFMPEPGDPSKKERAIFTKINDRQYSHRVEIDQGHGYAPVWQKVCSKQTQHGLYKRQMTSPQTRRGCFKTKGWGRAPR